MGIRFPADPNRELPSCRRASEEKQGINRQEPGVGGLTKTEMTSSPFQRFSRKYSKEEISLEIVLKGRDSDIARVPELHSPWTEPRRKRNIPMREAARAKWARPGRERASPPAGRGRADLRSSQSPASCHAWWKISTHV